MAWASLFAKMRFHRRLAALVASIDVETAVRRYAARCGFPDEGIETRSFLGPLMRIPELAAFPRELEFDGAVRDTAHDVGALVDLERSHPSVRPWPESSRPLVYCTLGTLPYLSSRAVIRFVRNVVETFSRRHDCNLFVNLAGQADTTAFAPPPRHVVLAERGPQLALVRQASLVISHAGVNTVKESLFFGVPVIAFPLGFDHEGVAARITAHGTGLRGDVRHCAPRHLAPLVERGLGDDAIRQNAKAIGLAMRSSDDHSRSIEAVESLLGKDSSHHVRHRRLS
jgi:UDP:flavonoid glycosyltransferase YjiC (YdhE family)